MNSTRISKGNQVIQQRIKDRPTEKIGYSQSYPQLGFYQNENPLSINYQKAFIDTFDSPYIEFYQNVAPKENGSQIVQLISDRRNDCKSSSIGQYIEQEQFSHGPQIKQEEGNQQDKHNKISEIKQNSKLKMQVLSEFEEQRQSGKSQQQQYIPQSFSGKQSKNRKACQTKNITKNFGKAIITFILKERQFTKKFCKFYNLDQKTFLRKVKSFQNKVATIKGLRQFWLEENNPYAKYVRMLSMRYLRKYSLYHIFNSRIQNYSINIKYRAKMIQSLSNPEQFTSIKEN